MSRESNSDDTVKLKACPFCKEDIRSDAIKCKHCGSMLNNVTDVREKQSQDKGLLYISKKKNGFIAAIFNIILPGGGSFYCNEYRSAIVAFLIFIGALYLYHNGYIPLVVIVGFYIVLFIDGFISAYTINQKLAKSLAAGGQRRVTDSSDQSSELAHSDLENEKEKREETINKRIGYTVIFIVIALVVVIGGFNSEVQLQLTS